MKKQIYFFIIILIIILVIILFYMSSLEKSKEGLGASEAVSCYSNLLNELNELNEYIKQNHSNDTILSSKIDNLISHINCIHGAVTDIGSNSNKLVSSLINNIVSNENTKQSVNEIISSSSSPK